MSESNHITWHDSEVTKEERQNRNGHKSAVIWFTRLSGSVNQPYPSLLKKHYSMKGNKHTV